MSKSRVPKSYVFGIILVCALMGLSSVIGYLTFGASNANVPDTDPSPAESVTPYLNNSMMCFTLPALVDTYCNGTTKQYYLKRDTMCVKPPIGKEVTKLPDHIIIHFNATNTWGPTVLVGTDAGQQEFQPTYYKDTGILDCSQNGNTTLQK